jgi:hypothetical protein
MRIGVVGLWHLGSVTAACLGSHFEVIGYDSDAKIVSASPKGAHPCSSLGSRIWPCRVEWKPAVHGPWRSWRCRDYRLRTTHPWMMMIGRLSIRAVGGCPLPGARPRVRIDFGAAPGWF